MKKVTKLQLPKTSKISLIILLILVSSFLSSNVIIVQTQTNLPPKPYITSPANTELMTTTEPNLIKVYEEQVKIRVIDLTEENDITSALFEFSPDGIIWLPIGEDVNKDLDGIQFTGNNGEASTNAWGTTGWNINWDTTELTEGYYFLRATLIDQSLQQGTTEIAIHYDPTPPFFDLNQEPTTNQGILGPLNETFTFIATTTDEDPLFLTLDYINASRPAIDQQGLGNANQENVGTPNTNGTPQTDDDQNNFCGPTSAANALWRLAEKDPALKTTSQGGQFNNATEMAEELGNDTKTDPVNGTATDDMTDGLKKYLKKRNLDGNYTVKPHIPKVGGRGPWWSDVALALRQGEAVIMLKVQPGSDGIVGTPDDIGHYETGKDAQPYPQGGGEVSVRDPRGPTDKSGKVKVVPKNNNFEGIWFDEDKDGQQDPGEIWYLLAFWEISPNNDYTWDLQSVEYTHLGEDLDPTDGLSISVQTILIHDGFYLLRAKMHDTTGNIGMNRTTIYINNHPPTPVTLQTPTIQDVTTNSVTLKWTQNNDEDFIHYQILQSETQNNSGTPVHNITDWTQTTYTVNNLESNKTYYFTIKTTDYSGLSSDSNQIQAPETIIPEFPPTTLVPVIIGLSLIILLFRKQKTKPNK